LRASLLVDEFDERLDIATGLVGLWLLLTATREELERRET
jgi:hypothetical protein